MASPKLIKVSWLKNGGLVIEYRIGGQMSKRFEGPGGNVSVTEAAKALGTYELKLYRLIDGEGISVSKNGNGTVKVPMSEVLRLKREWARS